MKKLVLAFVISISFVKPYAQTNPNVVRDGGQWDFYHIGVYPSAIGVTSFYTLGTDTVIGSLTYKKVLCREKVDTAEEKTCPWSLREDEKRLYLYDHTTQIEHVLCDFSLRPGDTLVTDWPWVPPVFIVDKVGDTILPGGDTPLRYLAVHDTRRHGADLWVEKIGPLHYGISWDYLWMAEGVINELLCYTDKGDMCYQNPAYKTCCIHYDTGTFRGKIVSVPAPLSPYTEGTSTFGLRVDTITYTLAPVHINFESFTFGGKSYAIGDSVEVGGKVYNLVDDAYEEFLMLSVQTIRKYETGDLWGKIVYVPEFYVQGEIGEGAPYAVFGLKTDSEAYVLTNDSVFLFGSGKFNVAEQVCSVGDSVEISGQIHALIDDNTVTFSALEIKNINILTAFSPEKISGTFTGRLALLPNPATEIPVMPGLVMGLQCDGKQYVLSQIGWFWDDDYIKIGGIRYEEGDSVEIKGAVSTHIDLLNRTYFELEIDTINKINTLLQQDDYLSEGKEWVMRNLVSGMFFDGGYVNFRSVLILDEVEKYGHIWKRSLSDGIEYWLYRQEGKKIWVTYPYDDDERETSPLLIFDFGLKKGDTAHLYGSMNETWIVEDVFDSVFEKEIGIKHCFYVYLMEDPERKDLWVEGVGSLTRGIDYAPANYVGGWSELICVQNSAREVLYHNARYTECNYPNHFSYDYSIQNWSVLCTGGGETPRHTELMRFKEEGRKQWNQAYRATQEDFSDEKPLGWYYQDMLQVYFKEKEADTAILLYDFGLEKGECFLNENHEIWAVDSVYYEKIDGLERRCQRMVSETGEVDIWVEGIGSLKTGFFPADFFDEHSATELLCVQADVFWHRNYMYHNARYNTCYIVEETSTEKTDESCAMVRYDAAYQTLVIESDVRIDRLEVFDARGQGVMTADRPAGSVSVARLPHGLYLYRLTTAGTTLSGKFVR